MLTICAILFFFLFGIACYNGLPYIFFVLWPPGREEIERAKSPDLSLDAVVVRLNPGAMSSFQYHVYIVPAGSEPKERDEVFSAENVRGLEIKWQKSRLLGIHYEHALISHFTNIWVEKGETDQPQYWVEIRLVPPKEGSAISPYQ
jgi:hypothetical protein